MKSKQKSTTMRRTLLMIMAVALLLTQCRKPAVEFPTAEPANTVSMTITAGPGGKTDISETGGITWSEGDRIYVGHDGKYVGYLTLVSGQNTPTGTFTGDVTLPNSTTGEQTFHFFYLGSGPQTLTAGSSTQATVSFASQTGLRGGLGSCHVGHGSAKGAVSAGGVTGISVMMKSEVALSRFSFKKSGTSEGYPGALTLSGDNIYNSMKVNFGGTFTGEKTDGGKISLTNPTSSEKYVMLVPAGATAATLKFDAGAGTTDCNLANGIEANKYYGQGGAIGVMVKMPVPVTGVTLNKTELSLEVGAYETLTATVAPADATNKNVTWDSSDETKATVDQNGVVTAVAAGPATITVTTVDGGKTATCTVTVTAPPYLPGEFTINSGGTKVKFSKGNLYYDADDNECHWKFEANQYDFRTYSGKGSCINGTYSSSSGTPANDWGLFGWSTDAASNNWGMHTKTSSTAGYTDGNFKDWGGITDLPSAGEGKTWCTLSSAEWTYLLDTRAASTIGSTSNARYAEVKVNGVCGMMLFPDTFTWPSDVTTKPTTFNTYSSTWNGVDYDTADFGKLESHGVVFLPAAGYRDSFSGVKSVGSVGALWTSTGNGSDYAYRRWFDNSSVSVNRKFRYDGQSVRLVRAER